PDRLEIFALGGSQLFRGFDLAERQGAGVWLASVEWRAPLVQDRCWGVCDNAATVKGIWLAPFYDVGAAYCRGKIVDDVAQALGVGVRMEVDWFGLLERSTLRLDVARPLNSVRPVQFW